MNTKIRALLWEQFRVAGTLTLWVLAICAIFLLLRSRYLENTDYLALAAFLMMMLPLLFLLRQNTAGHLDVRFEPHLSRLPVTAAPLAFIPAGMRLLCILCFYLALNGVYLLLFRETISPRLLVYACALYAVAQALLWTRIYLLLVLIPLAVSMDGLLQLFRVVSSENMISTMVDSIQIIQETLFCLALLPPALLLIWLGVCWERRNEQRRLFSLQGITGVAQGFRRQRTRGFDSVVEARVWFERSRNGVNIVVLTMAVIALFYPAVRFLGGRVPDRLADMFFLPACYARTLPPYLAVVLVGLALGVTREFTRHLWPLSFTEFSRAKPLSDAHLAWCHILVMSRYAFIALLVMFGLVAVFNVYFFPTELRILATAFDERDTVLLPIAWFIQPLFLGCVLTWLALWCTRPLVVGAVVALVGVFANSQLGGFGVLYFYAFLAYLMLRSGRLLHYAWQQHILSRRAWYFYLALHLVLPLLAWFPGPSGLVNKLDSFFIVCALTALLLSPIIALPRQIARKRVLS